MGVSRPKLNEEKLKFLYNSKSSLFLTFFIVSAHFYLTTFQAFKKSTFYKPVFIIQMPSLIRTHQIIGLQIRRNFAGTFGKTL
jgi:hypothetical protein